MQCNWNHALAVDVCHVLLSEKFPHITSLFLQETPTDVSLTSVADVVFGCGVEIRLTSTMSINRKHHTNMEKKVDPESLSQCLRDGAIDQRECWYI